MMAFVLPTPSLRFTSFTRPTIDAKPQRPAFANFRMSADDKQEDEDSSPLAMLGKSLWKESYFSGGFPGGEASLRKWIEEGMTADIPDMPKAMQPSAEFIPKVLEKTGILAALDKIEFFPGFPGDDESDDESDDEPKSQSKTKSKSMTKSKTEEAFDPKSSERRKPEIPPSEILKTEIPDEDLYKKYFPSEVRNIAPEISIRYNKDRFDRVGVAMTEVSASYTDLHFPKETKNKAPFIQIFYPNSLSAASVGVSLETVDPLPTLPVPRKAGQLVTNLVPGSGGGLKLSFETEYGEKLRI